MLYNYYVSYSLDQTRLIEGRTKYIHRFTAAIEHAFYQQIILLIIDILFISYKHYMKSFIIIVLCLFATSMAAYVAPLYAEWAHSHVVWINGKQQNQDAFLKMIDNYEKNGIKVGGALIDSAWSTGFNNFEWDKKKFPHPEDIVNKLHAKDIRVILWVTSMINNDTNIYQEAKKNNYLLNHGKVVKWWHGHGGFLDYLNPKAVQWWHKLIDKVLNIGIDGFKCDGTDPISALLKPRPYSPYAKRYIMKHEYGHHYYGDFYNYTKSKNEHALIMARPTDTFSTYTSWNYAPKYVMFSGWVGDQDSSADGFRKAMYNILKSAWNGYLNFGFDIGGYRGQNISKSMFLRWVQVGALVPFMENGGNGKHQPWLFDSQTVDIYRKFVDLHYQLKPTFLSCASEKFGKKKSVITPLADKIPQDSIKLPSTYVYLLCDNLLVSPIFEQTGQAELVFPIGSNWVYYFDHNKVFKGGSRQFYAFNLDQTALFMKTNSVIVLQDQILVIALNQGTKIQKTFIYGEYSENLSINYSGQNMIIKVDRYYKHPQVMNTGQVYAQIRLIGYDSIQFSGSKLGLQNNRIKIKVSGEQIILRNVRLNQMYSGQSKERELISQ